MAYLGKQPIVGNYQKIDSLVFNGIQTNFPLTSAGVPIIVGSAQNLILSINGVIQEPNVEYSINDSTLFFATPPLATDAFFAVVLGSTYDIGVIPDESVTTQKIVDNAVTTNKIANNAVTGVKIADNSISTEKIVDNAVTSLQIADNSITTNKITDNAVTGVKIADNAVSNAKILDGAVTNAKIADNAISTAKISDTAVTFAKLNVSATRQLKLDSSSTLFDTAPTYSAGATYQVGDSVIFNLKRYVAKTINTGVTPVNGTNWLLIQIPNQLILTMTADVVNNNATANTLQTIPELSFPVLAGESYRVRAVINYTSAATTTGSRWTLSGPTTSTLAITSKYTLTATSETTNFVSTFGSPAAANATSLTAGNIAIIEGLFTTTTSGTLAVQFASEISASAITAKAGSYLIYEKIG